MAGYSSLAQAMSAILSGGTHSSRHRKARVLRFIYKYPHAREHRAVIARLRKLELRRIRERREQFARRASSSSSSVARTHGGQPWQRRAHRG